jgi:uncharacterized protein
VTKASCPACRGEAVKEGNKVWPFCSARCQWVDMGRWLNEEYRVPEEPDASGGGVESSTPAPREDK